jgi:hypothetical protein
VLRDKGEIPNLRLGTLGRALGALLQRVSRGGVPITLKSPVGVDENAKVAKVANVAPLVFVHYVKNLVELAITQAMMYGSATWIASNGPHCSLPVQN